MLPQAPKLGFLSPKRAIWFESGKKNEVLCTLCPRQCVISKGKRGYCKVRENRGGELYTLAHSNPCSLYLDPIEKAPFFHVLPGSMALCLATAGCNLACKFCQNWEVSQAAPEEVFNFELSPSAVVERTKAMAASSIVFTYVEPVVSYEYVLETAKLAKANGLKLLLHTNGYINPAPLKDLLEYISGLNIDLKALEDGFYRELCDGSLTPVLKTLKIAKNSGIHLEMTTLIIPTKNDETSQVKAMCSWILTELGPDVPLHLWRFYPLNKMRHLPPTPEKTLELIREIALDMGLRYVYIGNIPKHSSENTYCPTCNSVTVERVGYMVKKINIKEGTCGKCGSFIPGIWA